MVDQLVVGEERCSWGCLKSVKSVPGRCPAVPLHNEMPVSAKLRLCLNGPRVGDTFGDGALDCKRPISTTRLSTVRKL